MSFKKNLLKWVQNQTGGPTYKLKIRGFKSDWRNGLAFVALLHSFDHNAFDYSDFKAEEDAKNLEYAFTNAKNKFDIENILDVDDITDFRIPDDILVITYLTLWYQYYAKNKRKIQINSSRPRKARKKRAGGSNKDTFDKMQGALSVVNKKNEEKAKANWNFIKDHVKKIEIDFEKVANDLEDEFGDVETPVFFSPTVSGKTQESLFDQKEYDNVLPVTPKCSDALKLFCEGKITLCPVMITKGKYYYEPKNVIRNTPISLPKDLVDRFGTMKFPRYLLINGEDEERYLVCFCPAKVHSKTKRTYDENRESFVGAVCAGAGFSCTVVETSNLGEVSMRFLRSKK